MTMKDMSLLEIARKQRAIDVSGSSRANKTLARRYAKHITAVRLREHELTLQSAEYKSAYARVRAEEKRRNKMQKMKQQPLAFFAKAKMAITQGVQF